jgi:hypothetical protein
MMMRVTAIINQLKTPNAKAPKFTKGVKGRCRFVNIFSINAIASCNEVALKNI